MGIRTDASQKNLTGEDGTGNRNQATVIELQAEARNLYIPRPDSHIFAAGT